jgi:hypothetical protein
MQGAKWHNWLLAIVLVMQAMAMHGQAPSATLTCRQKLVQVGRPFEVELSVRHPERMVVVFPDTLKDFKPYEVHSGKPIPTSTNDGLSEDVKIYQLYTWEIDSVQHLQFPVRYLTTKGDTEVVMSNVVDVEYQPTIAAFSDTLKVRAIGDLAVIQEPVNWVAWGIIFTVLALLIVIAVIVFAKPLTRMVRRAKIEREWRKYLGQLEAVRGLATDQQAYYAGLNKVWRLYFDRDWYLALGSRTTTELGTVIDQLKALDEADATMLMKLSGTADMVLYADRAQPEEQGKQFWEDVKRIMTKEYHRRKEAVEL